MSKKQKLKNDFSTSKFSIRKDYSSGNYWIKPMEWLTWKNKNIVILQPNMLSSQLNLLLNDIYLKWFMADENFILDVITDQKINLYLEKISKLKAFL